jgi:hypothetical protein
MGRFSHFHNHTPSPARWRQIPKNLFENEVSALLLVVVLVLLLGLFGNFEDEDDDENEEDAVMALFSDSL